MPLVEKIVSQKIQSIVSEHNLSPGNHKAQDCITDHEEGNLLHLPSVFTSGSAKILVWGTNNPHYIGGYYIGKGLSKEVNQHKAINVWGKKKKSPLENRENNTKQKSKKNHVY